MRNFFKHSTPETGAEKAERMGDLEKEIDTAYKLFYGEKDLRKADMIKSVFDYPNEVFSHKTVGNIPCEYIRQWKFELEAKLTSSKLRGLYETHSWPTNADHCELVRSLFKDVARDILQPWKNDPVFQKLMNDDSSLQDVVLFVEKRVKTKTRKDDILLALF